MKPSRSEYLDYRGRRYRLRRWGDPAAPMLFMLHGWMDVSASFQFLVDALRREWNVIAPDWRGFGDSTWDNDCYWFPNYLADLEGFLDHFSPNDPVTLIGHSMGANASSMYAGTRPQRVARLVNLEGLAPVPGYHDLAPPGRMGQWLDQVRRGTRNRSYASRADLASRLIEANPRLTAERADFLAAHFGRETPSGRIEASVDPWHRVIAPNQFPREHTLSFWREITAPVLCVWARDSHIVKRFAARHENIMDRVAVLRDARTAIIDDAGHNMHHDQPEQLAALIEDFLA